MSVISPPLDGQQAVPGLQDHVDRLFAIDCRRHSGQGLAVSILDPHTTAFRALQIRWRELAGSSCVIDPSFGVRGGSKHDEPTQDGLDLQREAEVSRTPCGEGDLVWRSGDQERQSSFATAGRIVDSDQNDTHPAPSYEVRLRTSPSSVTAPCRHRPYASIVSQCLPGLGHSSVKRDVHLVGFSFGRT